VWKGLFTKKLEGGAAVPNGVRIYAIGDIHGRADLVAQLFARVDSDLAARPVSRPIEVFLGDYIDRGPASREVLDALIERSRAHETIYLTGNHEIFLTEFLQNPAVIHEWRRFGGVETLTSYGISVPAKLETAEDGLASALANALPETHRLFLTALRYHFVCGDFFFVHAGVRPGVSLASQDDEDLLWIRDEFLACDEDFGKIIVHGHTPVQVPDVRHNRINIDTGAYATGRLTCLRIEGDRLSFLR
jgi:serine/threonine protein phosphatase 1